MNLKNKKIIICVSGGIAAYKACEIVRLLIKEEANVRVAMTKAATQFVSPLTFESLTNHEVAHVMFPNQFIATRHIDWADWADLLLFVPATANTIAKLAHGFSDDIVTTITLAFTGKKLIAPAMNTNMWNNSIVKENIEHLKKHGFIVMGTSFGDLACGWTGEGRLADYSHIMQYVYYTLADKPLKGKKIVINAGPTMEKIDPVRYISNNSSGKMGYSLAKAAWTFGADVHLITGPTHIELPYDIQVTKINNAEELYEASLKLFKKADIFIASAAVADYKPNSISKQKIKKDSKDVTLTLTKNVDVLFELGQIKQKQYLVGFALETENGKKNAFNKIMNKNLDLIILNESNTDNQAFGSDYNTISIINKDESLYDLDHKPKSELAYDIMLYLVDHA